MKESRFIELLNLYVDQQLSSVEAAELEVEIQKHGGRRRTYQQYCRMQKACTRLFEEERAQAPASITLSRALSDADRKIVAFPTQSRGRFRQVVYVAGLLGAAACVAIVALPRRGVKGPVGVHTDIASSSVPVTIRPTTIVPTAALSRANSVFAALPPAPSKPELYTILTIRRNLTAPTDNGADASFASDSNGDRPSFDWMRTVNLQPLRKTPVDELSFDSRPVTVAQPENRVFTGRRPVQGSMIETIGFQFTK